MRPAAPVLLSCLLLFSGCAVQPSGSGSGTAVDTPTETPGEEATTRPTATTTPATPERIESELWELRTAANRTEYAQTRGLTIDNGSVRVVVVLRAGRAPPASLGTVGAVQGNEAVLTVPIDDLRSLATHRNVTYVRAPEQPVADS